MKSAVSWSEVGVLYLLLQVVWGNSLYAKWPTWLALANVVGWYILFVLYDLLGPVVVGPSYKGDQDHNGVVESGDGQADWYDSSDGTQMGRW